MRATSPRILIIRHPDDPFDSAPYVIHVLAEQWRKRGLDVEVSSRVPPQVDSDALIIPHLDLTRTPPEHQAFFSACPRVLNRSVTDISKRRISNNLVRRTDTYDGPVIVKTDRNAGGDPEKLKLRARGKLGQTLLKIGWKLPWTITGLLNPGEYKIYEHAQCVPWEVWHNPRLVVEKFLPERQGDQYCLRQYVFLGDREINTLAVSPDPLVKSWNVTRREILSETPPELREARKSLGFDFGKFDYVMRDGKAVLFDANRTPTYNAASAAGSPSQLLLDLSKGIESFYGVAA